MQATAQQAASPDQGIASRIFSVPPGEPFLKRLAASLVDGTLVSGFRPLDDPLLLSTAIVYLPTRRAARALAAELVEAMGGRAALLPSIRTLGDAEEDEFEIAAAEAGEIDLPDAIPQAERRLVLANFVRRWTAAMSRETRALYGDEDIVIPSSAAEALRMADELGRLLDSMETEEVSWDALPGLVRDAAEFGDAAAGRWAEWWNVTLKFLAVVSETWPEYLAERKKLDPSQRRRMLLDARSQRLLNQGSPGPVIAAGSTGSIPATARLIAAIAAQPNGAVVLPGLDTALDADIWAKLAQDDSLDDTHSLCTHPQYGLARLVHSLGIGRDEIRILGGEPGSQRMGLVSAAMLPAEATGRWQAATTHLDAMQAVSGIALVEAPGEREEALAIAIAMRETLETPGRTAALVTPDRMLARRVAAELERFAIRLEDTAGTPLANAGAGRLARLVAALATGRADPVGLASLLKHAAVCAGEAAHRTARLYELAVLRGAVTPPLPGRLAAAARDKSVARLSHPPAEVAAMTPDDWVGVIGLGERIDATLAPLLALRDGGAGRPLETWLAALRQTLDKLLVEPAKFFASGGGRELGSLLDAFTRAGETGFTVEPHEFPDVLAALLEGASVRSSSGHPRLSILGPLEARLQHADLVILGGMNEGSWPGAARNDPFLNRPMRASVGLSLPERRIGQAAHDFQQLSGGGEVMWTRSLKADNAPTVASRWLQRLAVTAGQDAAGTMTKRGDRLLALARTIDESPVRIPRSPRPDPRPDVALRPKKLSVTQVETWIRDPYAIHARYVLGLEALPPLEREADPLLRGQIYHAILARFITEPEETDAALRMKRIAQECFEAENVPLDVAAIWLPRFETIGRLFIDWERGRTGRVAGTAVETGGRVEVGATGFVLTGRADRIDVLKDGTLAIIDYKTGSSPSTKQARSLSPQLALEAKMAELGAFPHLPAGATASDLAYVRLRPGETLKVDHICEGKDAPDPQTLVETAWRRLEELIAAYRRPEQGYKSRYAPMRDGEIGGDYDHLARVREWSTGGDEGGRDE